MRATRRTLQVGLGVLWLVDGALQLQPFMLGHGFADQIIAPAGQGQPGFVSVGVNWAVDWISAYPMLWDYLFALVQLLIGLGLLLAPTVRTALVVSVGWAVGVWYFGEGLGGLASGHADLLTGAPGAALLYAVLAVAAWPVTDRDADDVLMPRSGPPAGWLPVAWAVLWVGGAFYRALPGQNSSAAVADEIGGNADGAPTWLAQWDRAVATAIHGYGPGLVVGLVLLEVAIGLGALFPGVLRWLACTAGMLLSLGFWVVGQSLGEVYTGQATDPNAAPLVILLALATASASSRQPALQRAPAGQVAGPEETAPG